MTKDQEKQYKPTDDLRQILTRLKGQKFVLDCGHHITFGHAFGNDITILNNWGKSPKIICSQCGY